MSQQKRGLLGIGIGVAVVVMLVFAIMPSRAPGIIRIAVVLPTNTNTGNSMVNAVELAVGQSRLADQIEILPYDTRANGTDNIIETNIEHMEAVIADPSIVAVIGATSSNMAQDSIPMTNRAGLLLVSPSATTPGLTKSGYRAGEPGIYYPTGKRNFYRTIPSDETQGAYAAAWMGERDINQVLLITIEDEPYTQGLAGIFETNASDHGVEIAEKYVIDRNQDIREIIDVLLADIEGVTFNAIYFPLLSNLNYADIVVALHEAYPDALIMGGEGMVYETFPDDQTLRLYATIMPPNPANLESASAFIEAFTSAYETEPTSFAMTTYDAAKVVLAAIETAADPYNRESVLDAMQQLDKIEGAQGTFEFLTTGDIDLLAIEVVKFENGDWVTVNRD